MNTDRLREPNQISARMTNDATGTVFIASTGGASHSSTRLNRAASAASSVPSAAARKKPPRMRAIDPSSDAQNRAVGSSASSVAITRSGDTSRISLSSAMLAACQTSSQSSTAHSGSFFFSSLCA